MHCKSGCTVNCAREARHQKKKRTLIDDRLRDTLKDQRNDEEARLAEDKERLGREKTFDIVYHLTLFEFSMLFLMWMLLMFSKSQEMANCTAPVGMRDWTFGESVSPARAVLQVALEIWLRHSWNINALPSPCPRGVLLRIPLKAAIGDPAAIPRDVLDVLLDHVAFIDRACYLCCPIVVSK